MEPMFEVAIDEETRLAWGIPLDDLNVENLPEDPMPEAELAAILESTAAEAERAGLSGWGDQTGRIDAVLGLREQLAGVQAREIRELAALATDVRSGRSSWYGADADVAFRSLIADLAVAYHVSDRSMSARVNDALELVESFPATLRALERGAISQGHVRVIVDRGRVIADQAARARYEALVIERAIEVTPGRLSRFAQLTAAQVGEVTFQERFDRANTERRVWVTEVEDGMSEVAALVPTLLAEGIWDRLTAQAKAVKSTGDPRTLDQIRADLFAELVLTGQPSGCADAPHAPGIGIRAEVAVVIPMLTFLGLSEEPATVAGKSPIDPATARALAGDAKQLERLITHPVTGIALSADTYKPSAKLRRYLRLRDGRCRFASCNRAARRCDIDHTIAWEIGGKTVPDNLECLCRGHHTLKHHGGWQVRQTEPGVLEWTSPSGRVTIDRPDSAPRFS